jgi:hypothetical protein
VDNHAFTARAGVQRLGHDLPIKRHRLECRIGAADTERLAPDPGIGLDIRGKPHGKDGDLPHRPIGSGGKGQAVRHPTVQPVDLIPDDIPPARRRLREWMHYGRQ